MIRKFGEQADRVTGERTIYDVSWGELVGRNFVAGMSRALGGLLFNVVLIVILGTLAVRYVWPQLQPVVENLRQSYQTLYDLEESLSQLSQSGSFPLMGESLQFDIHQLGEPGSQPKSVELNAGQLEELLFGVPTQAPAN